MSSRRDYKTASIHHCFCSATTLQVQSKKKVDRYDCSAYILSTTQAYKASLVAANLTRAQNKMGINWFPWGVWQEASWPHVIIFRQFENSTELNAEYKNLYISYCNSLEYLTHSADKIKKILYILNTLHVCRIYFGKMYCISVS